jgi:hypothetical protein
VQVADRRLTYPSGALFSDHAMKLIVGCCADASFLVAYTGLAYVPAKPQQRTDHWIVEALQSRTNLSFNVLISDLKMLLRSSFKNKGPATCANGLTVVLVGFFGDIPFFCSLSNQETQNGKILAHPSTDFTVTGMIWRNPGAYRLMNFAVHGSTAAILPKTPAGIVLKKVRHRYLNKDATSLCHALVQVTRLAATNPEFGKYIGKDCVSAVYTPDGNSCSYHYPSNNVPLMVLPHVVLPSASFQDIAVFPGNATFEEFDAMVKDNT